jgi:hypothetical protein
VGVYTAIAICVAGFIVFGRLTPGQVMIFDTDTPPLVQTLIVAVIGSAIVACCMVVRNKFGTLPVATGDGTPSPGPGRG